MGREVGKGLAMRQAKLSRRPGKMTSAEEVDVQMRNGLSAVGAVVDNEAEAFG